VSRLLLAAKSGWGKSWLAQQRIERDAAEHDLLVVMDYKDEYKGLVKAGLANWAAVTRRELSLSAADWQQFIEDNGRLVLSRAVDDDDWQQVAAKVARAVRDSHQTALIVIDEAHFVAPQRTGYPKAIRGLATTGRGEGVSSMWVVQRLAEMDETPVAQSDMRIVGGLTSGADLGKLAGSIDYPEEVHNPSINAVTQPLPNEIDRDGQPLQVHIEDGNTVGSEWIYSDDTGDLRRIDSRKISMDSTHHSPEGNSLSIPGE
jgi:DNA helicase HerA-like ATPase